MLCTNIHIHPAVVCTNIAVWHWVGHVLTHSIANTALYTHTDRFQQQSLCFLLLSLNHSTLRIACIFYPTLFDAHPNKAHLLSSGATQI